MSKSETPATEQEPVAWQILDDSVAAVNSITTRKSVADIWRKTSPNVRPLYARPVALDMRPDEWQPIESAPKDGTLVDLWVGTARMTDCRWESSPYTRNIPWGWTNQNLGRITIATHWMSVPSAPIRALQQQAGRTDV